MTSLHFCCHSRNLLSECVFFMHNIPWYILIYTFLNASILQIMQIMHIFISRIVWCNSEHIIKIISKYMNVHLCIVWCIFLSFFFSSSDYLFISLWLLIQFFINTMRIGLSFRIKSPINSLGWMIMLFYLANECV